MGKKERRKQNKDDEPELEPGEWVEWGGELYWPVGFTAGGAPYRRKLEEYQAIVEESDQHSGWARAKRLLRRAFSWGGEDEPWVGRVTKVGEGLSRDIYGAEVLAGFESRTSSCTEIRFHEICLRLGWCREEPMATVLEQHRNMLKRVLRDAEAGDSR